MKGYMKHYTECLTYISRGECDNQPLFTDEEMEAQVC